MLSIFHQWSEWSQCCECLYNICELKKRFYFVLAFIIFTFSNNINAYHESSQSHQNRSTCILFLASLFLDKFLYCRTIFLNILEVIWIWDHTDLNETFFIVTNKKIIFDRLFFVSDNVNYLGYFCTGGVIDTRDLSLSQSFLAILATIAYFFILVTFFRFYRLREQKQKN